MIIRLPALRPLVMPALMAGVIGYLGYTATLRDAPGPPPPGPAPAKSIEVIDESDAHAVIVRLDTGYYRVTTSILDDPGPAPDPTPIPPGPAPTPTPVPVPVPVPPTPVPPTPTPTPVPTPTPSPAVTGPLFATMIFDPMNSSPALLSLRNEGPTIETLLRGMDISWHAWSINSKEYQTRIVPRLNSSQVALIGNEPTIVLQDKDSNVLRLVSPPATSSALAASMQAFREGK